MTADRLHPAILFALAVSTIVAAAGCSLALDLQECDSDEDCEEDYGQGWRCSADQLCEPLELECIDDEDCQDEHGPGWSCADENFCRPPEDETPCEETFECEELLGEGWTCSHAGVCEPPPDTIPCNEDGDCPENQHCNELNICQKSSDLFAPPCEMSAGPIDDDDAFIVGVLLPLTGDEAGFGLPLFDAITLAVGDFNTVDGVDGRPVAVLACDTEGQNDLALQGAEHLADTGVEAVIGPDYSDQTIEVATEVTVDAQMALVSPSATAAEISELDDDGLVWRTTASDAVQGRALGELVAYLLDERPHYALTQPSQIPDEPAVAILHRGNDPYAGGLTDQVVAELPDEIVDDEDRFELAGYANVAAGEDENYESVIASVTGAVERDGFGPDVVVIAGSAEAWDLAEMFEILADDNFANSPVYVFADAARNLERSEQAPESLQQRVWGTAPRNVADIDYQPYTHFQLRYQQQFGEDPADFQFVPHAFDAMYVLGLGAAAAGVEGPAIADGMTRLSDGNTYEPSSLELEDAFEELSDGGSIDLQGASGPLNFDENGDPAPTPTALWCFEDDGLPEEGVIFDTDEQFTPESCIDQCTSADDCQNVPDNGTAVCDDGQCDVSCDDEFTLCNGDCVDTDADPDHCGGCSNACEPPTNATAVCENESCDFECHEGFELCDGECVDTDSNPEHCDGCNEPCNEDADEICQEGNCVTPDNGDNDEDNSGEEPDDEE